MAQDIAAKPYKALGSDLARSAKAARQRAEDTFLRLALPLQEMAAAGRDVGLEVRRKVERLRADQAVSRSSAVLDAALRRTDAALRQSERAIEFSNDSRRIRGMMAAVSGTASVQATPGQKALVRGADGIAAGIHSNEAAIRQTERVIEMSEGLSKLRATMARIARGGPVQAGAARRDLAGAAGNLAAAVRRNDVELRKLEAAVEASQAVRVGWEMRRYPVNDHTDTGPVAGVDEAAEALRRAETA